MQLMEKRFFEGIGKYKDEFSGKPISILEIGVYAGVTARLFLSNFMDNPDSRYYGIDPWNIKLMCHCSKHFPLNETGYRRWRMFIAVLRKLRRESHGKLNFIKGFSQDILVRPEWVKRKNEFDLIHIDGHHTAHAVLRDFVLSWPLLKIGGIPFRKSFFDCNILSSHA